MSCLLRKRVVQELNSLSTSAGLVRAERGTIVGADSQAVGPCPQHFVVVPSAGRNVNERHIVSRAVRQQAGDEADHLGTRAVLVRAERGGSGANSDAVFNGPHHGIIEPVAFRNINQCIAAGDRVLGLLDEKSRIPEATGAVRLEQFRDSIEFRDVSFSYDDSRKVIDSVSFTIRKGETVALVGPSGGGKSTLSDLIPRFYDVQGGEILIDGVDLRRYRIDSLRAHMGVVSQDTILFNDTIENNLRLGKQEATEEEIRTAAKVANAHDFIMETEDGYRTNIGDRGMKLSGGQRQALTLLMATIKQPKLLLLDEHTAALDPKTAKNVLTLTQKIIAENHLTAMMVTHNMKDALEYGNRTIMMHEGKIILDIDAETKKRIHVEDLLVMFEKASGSEINNDRMLLG